MLLKKPELGLLEQRTYERVSTEKKPEMIELARRSPQQKQTTPREWDDTLDVLSQAAAVWGRGRSRTWRIVLRELACHVTDHAGFTVWEATVYRVLKRLWAESHDHAGVLSREQGELLTMKT